MDIDRYSFKEFMEMAASFHGYPAPGLLIGGYMVALAKKELPEDTLFEAIVESDKCLPDAVHLLTLCSTGNGWMKRVNLGRYALCLYDKYTGKGVRVFQDPKKLSDWPELRSWFFKLTPKKEQDSEQLFKEISEAGDSICTLQPVNVHKSYLTVRKSGKITTCPICKEAYPQSHGMPVLPGAMTLTGHIGDARVIGVPACALYFKRTSFDFLLPRVLAGVEITKEETAAMGEGGFCLNCKVCTFPKCPFGK